MLNIPQRGFTLIEFIVSSALGLLIALAALQAFILIKQMTMMQQAMARLQENGRMINSILGEAIANAGTIGCNGFNTHTPLRVHGISAKNYGILADQRLLGISREALFDNKKKKKNVLSRMAPESDILWIKNVTAHYPIENIATQSATLKGVVPWLAKDHGVVVIADCAQSDFLALKNDVQPLGKGLSSLNLTVDSAQWEAGRYKKGAKMGLLSSTLFYVGRAAHKNAQNNPVWALYASDLNAPHAYQLLEGVEFLSLRYGVLEKNKMIFYEKNNVSDWNRVRAVRARVLLNSIDDGLVAPKPYVIDKKTYDPRDRLMRMWWEYEWVIKSF